MLVIIKDALFWFLSGLWLSWLASKLVPRYADRMILVVAVLGALLRFFIVWGEYANQRERRRIK